MAAEDWKKPPAHLGEAGRELWNEHCDQVADGKELSERERWILRQAAEQEDDNQRGRVEIEANGYMIEGRVGRVVNPAERELRQGREAVRRHLQALALEDTDGKPETEASRRGRRAVEKRWANERRKRGEA